MKNLLSRAGLFAMVLIGPTLASPSQVQAQEAPIIIGSMAIEVWPEYDQPSVLVFFRGQVVEDTPVPVELHFTLPPTATVNAVAYADPATGDLFDAEHGIDDNLVVMTSPTGAFHIEFYDAALQMTNEQRTYTLAWTADYAVAELFFQAQQPTGASDFVVEPSGGTASVAQDSLTYYLVEQTSIPARQPITLTVRYTKVNSILTVDALQATAEAILAAAAETTAGGYALDAPEEPSQRERGAPMWLIAAIAAGVVVVVGTAFLVLRTAGKFPGGGKGYCTRCGKPIRQGDSFCHHCGAKL